MLQRNCCVFVAATLVVALFSLTASAAPPQLPIPSGQQPQVGNPTGVHTSGCIDDRYEPDSLQAPQLIGVGHYEGLQVCGGNDDHWRIPVLAGQRVRMRVEFSHAVGDVDMTLHGADFSVIDVSEGVSDVEELTYLALSPETLILKVYGYDGISNTYSLVIDVDDFSTTCTGDEHEPNNGAGEAASPVAATGSARVCLGDEDWYAIDIANAGEGFDFGIDFDPALGQLSLGLYSATNQATPLQMVRTGPGSAMVTLGEADRPSRYYVRVMAEDGSFNDYTYSVARYSPGVAQTGTVSGLVQYEDQLRGQDVVIGAATTRWLPIRNVPIEIVRQIDDRVIATTYTDAAGNYSVPFVHRAEGEIYVRITARLESPNYTYRVVDSEETERTHSGRSPELSRIEQPTPGQYRLDFEFPESSALGGAFNITDRILDAMTFIERFQAPPDLDLVIVWNRGVPHACTSCYSNGRIYLGGGYDDPDEYDDSVILHEFGHYFIDKMSHDDSPGGNHNGDRTNPLVAYGEGIATVFAMMVDESPIYVDTMTSGGMTQDFERMAFPEGYGTQSGLLTGLVSEYLVVGLIWDLVDAANEGHDSLADGEDSVMRVLFDHMPTCTTQDQGVAGADLADFVHGFRMMYPESVDELNRVLAHYDFPGGALVTGHTDHTK